MVMTLEYIQVFLTSYLNLIYPGSDVEETAFWGHIVKEQDPVSFTEIRPGYAPEPTWSKEKACTVLCDCQRSSLFPYLSCPAVSQICRLVLSPSTNIFFIWKSTPEKNKMLIKTLDSVKKKYISGICASPVCSGAHPGWSECRPWIHWASTSGGSWTFQIQHLQLRPGGTWEWALQILRYWLQMAVED